MTRPRWWTGIAVDTLVTVTRPDGSELDFAPSLAVRNHSPAGFSWGYNGSGPAQLALALLLDAIGDPGVALDHYQEFKTDHVAGWPSPGGWVLTVGDLAGWIEERMGL